jgi:DNA uptake protein ComE-like DNA-binding protein
LEGEEERGGILGRTVGAILGVGTEPGAGDDQQPEEPDSGAEAEVITPEEPAKAEEPEPAKAPDADSGDRTNVNRATFEQLRDVGFSVTQATRVITYREREDGFESLDDLANVPGMPREFLGEVKPKLTL